MARVFFPPFSLMTGRFPAIGRGSRQGRLVLPAKRTLDGSGRSHTLDARGKRGGLAFATLRAVWRPRFRAVSEARTAGRNSRAPPQWSEA
jgi:hypothetical protein